VEHCLTQSGKAGSVQLDRADHGIVLPIRKSSARQAKRCSA